ncbi:MAG: hypothetical protein NXI27_19045 [Alphaproteobacteria bacterium]|nr:hypothetical protein [Alphaproteobacteria bacterium]
MMNDRDPMLQSLFAEAQDDLAGDAFVATLMSKVDRHVRLARLLWIGIGLALILCAWFAAGPMQEAALAVTFGLSQPLFPLHDGLFAALVAPLNTYAGVFALLLLIIRSTRRALFAS